MRTYLQRLAAEVNSPANLGDGVDSALQDGVFPKYLDPFRDIYRVQVGTLIKLLLQRVRHGLGHVAGGTYWLAAKQAQHIQLGLRLHQFRTRH
jgi:hypothetical protein